MPDIELFDGSLAQYLGDGVFSVSQESERGADTVMVHVDCLTRLLDAYAATDGAG
jgi:hypothetical protein